MDHAILVECEPLQKGLDARNAGVEAFHFVTTNRKHVILNLAVALGDQSMPAGLVELLSETLNLLQGRDQNPLYIKIYVHNWRGLTIATEAGMLQKLFRDFTARQILAKVTEHVDNLPQGTDAEAKVCGALCAVYYDVSSPNMCECMFGNEA